MNGTMFSMFSFVNRGISFFLLVILARYITPADYGRLSLFNTIVELLGYIVALSCQGFFSISYFQRKGDLFRQDTTSIILILIVCSSILGFILFVFQTSFANYADLPPLFLWIALAISSIQIFVYLLTDYLRVQEKVVKYGFLSCGIAILNFLLSIYLVVYRDFSWTGQVYASLICTIFFGCLGLMVFFKKKLLTTRVTWDGIKMILLWGIPLIPHSAANWIKQGCDRFIINDTYTIEDVGLFSFALTLTSIIIMIGTAFNSTNSVSIYQILSSDESSDEKILRLKRQTRNIGIIYTAGYIFVLLVSSLLVPIVLPRYVGSLPYFWIISVSGYLFCLYFLCVNYLFYYHKNKDIMVITFSTSVLHLLLSLWLTRYSLYLTSVIYVFSQLVVFILIYSKSQKLIREKLLS